jgi:type II secretory pathway component PulF
MPEYKYIARNINGRKVRGVLYSATPNELEYRLESRNEYLIDYKEIIVRTSKAARAGRSLNLFKVKKFHIAQFLDDFRIFVDAGVPMTTALEDVAETATPKLKTKILKIKTALENGSTLYEAFSEHRDLFDTITLEAVKIGEMSGSLVDILDTQAVRMFKEAALRKKIQGQSVYPIVLCTFVVGLLIVMNTSVIPKLMDSYKQFLTGTLPPKTKVIFGINNWLMDYGLIIPIMIIILVFLWVFARVTPVTARLKDAVIMSLPVFREFAMFVNLTYICSGLQVAINAGIPVPNAFRFLESTVTNVYIEDKIRAIRSDLVSGSTLAAAVKVTPLDPVFTRMVSAGESTGNLPYTMDKANKFYLDKVDGMIEVLFNLGMVAVLMILGVIVAFTMMSIIIPLYELPTVLTK